MSEPRRYNNRSEVPKDPDLTEQRLIELLGGKYEEAQAALVTMKDPEVGAMREALRLQILAYSSAHDSASRGQVLQMIQDSIDEILRIGPMQEVEQ